MKKFFGFLIIAFIIWMIYYLFFGNKSPEKPVITFPVDGKNYNSISNISWTKSSDPDGDKVYYELFLYQNEERSIASGLKGTNYTTRVSKKGTYYCKVRAYDEKGNESDSKTIKFSIGKSDNNGSNNNNNNNNNNNGGNNNGNNNLNLSVRTPELIYPPNKHLFEYVDVRLNWRGNDNNKDVRYKVFLEEYGRGMKMVASDVKQSEYVLSKLKNNTKYRWKVEAYVSNKVKKSSNTSEFTTRGITGTFTDRRDGKTYKYVQIGTQYWMSENLKYKAKVNCWTYKNIPEFYKRYGYLYDWNSAKNSCPRGWHLPSDNEWKILESFCGMKKRDLNSIDIRTRPFVGGLLKKGGRSGFNATFGGLRSERDPRIFYSADGIGHYWTSTPEGNSAYSRTFSISLTNMGRSSVFKDVGYSVRCVKD